MARAVRTKFWAFFLATSAAKDMADSPRGEKWKTVGGASAKKKGKVDTSGTLAWRLDGNDDAADRTLHRARAAAAAMLAKNGPLEPKPTIYEQAEKIAEAKQEKAEKAQAAAAAAVKVGWSCGFPRACFLRRMALC